LVPASDVFACGTETVAALALIGSHRSQTMPASIRGTRPFPTSPIIFGGATRRCCLTTRRCCRICAFGSTNGGCGGPSPESGPVSTCKNEMNAEFHRRHTRGECAGDCFNIVGSGRALRYFERPRPRSGNPTEHECHVPMLLQTELFVEHEGSLLSIVTRSSERSPGPVPAVAHAVTIEASRRRREPPRIDRSARLLSTYGGRLRSGHNGSSSARIRNLCDLSASITNSRRLPSPMRLEIANRN
jgi:hypothetical protein